MKRIGVRLFIVLAGLAALVHVVTLSGEASTALRFSGLRHVALGAASLDPRLLVSNLGTAGDGVSIMTRRARGWSARELRVVPRTLDWSVKFEAEGRVGRERTAPTLSVRELKDGGRDRFLIGFAPAFGTSTYRIEIYDGPTVVFAATGFESGSQSVLNGNDAICDAIGKSESVALGICEWVVSPDFRQNDDFECEFSIEGQRKEFFLPDGTEVLGTRIRFIENSSEAPEVAVFTRINIRTAFVRTLGIGDEALLQE